MKAKEIRETLTVVEGLIRSAKNGAIDRESGNLFGDRGINTNQCIKDKLRIAKGLINEVALGIDRDSFRD